MSLAGHVPRLRSFRSRFLLIVFGAAIVPLLVVTLWLTRSVARGGESLVRERLETDISMAARRVGERWMLHRSRLLDAVEDPEISRAVAAGRSDLPTTPVEGVALEGFLAVRLLDTDSRPLFSLKTVETRRTGTASIPMLLPVRTHPFGDPVGKVEAQVTVAELLPETSPGPGGIATLLGMYETDGLVPLRPLPFLVEGVSDGGVTWGGERWFAVSRSMREPRVTLVAAAPISPLARPFEAAAREGALLLVVAGSVALLLAFMLTTGMTRSLGQLAIAAEAVAGGDLERRVDDDGEDEVRRVGRAFNRMTESLRKTLQELADHRALAAVGEFAASLAHEIRNPLSAARLDLQVVEEELPPGSPLRRLQHRALSEIERMDATLGGTLQTARSGRWEPRVVRLRGPLEAAVRSVPRSREGTGGAATGVAVGEVPTIDWVARPDVEVRGDPAALRQLFLNLLLNAREAAGPDGTLAIRVEREGPTVVVRIEDDGPGIPEELLPRIREPLVSGREGGTGLGLAIADRIARAHGGSLHIESEPGVGTIQFVRLRAAPTEEPDDGM